MIRIQALGKELNLKTMIEFFMPMKKPPTATHQEKKAHVVNGKPIYYEPAPLKRARADLFAHLAKYKPAFPITRGVRLTTKWLFPPGTHTPGTYRITKPDTDNLQKLLKDCMTEVGFWKDDALVASEFCEKFWAEDDLHTGIYIKVEILP